MTNQEISHIRDKYQIQLQVDELKLIINELKPGLNFLVFGLGNDTPFWMDINKSGKTIFIEDLEEWVEKTKRDYPEVNVYLTKYNTVRSDWKKLINHPELLTLNLSSEIKNIKWDVILVDAPMGWEDGQPGRMISIYQASQLIKDGGHIFVHDCEREVENIYTNEYLLPRNFIGQNSKLRHYLFSGKNTLAHQLKVVLEKILFKLRNL